MFVDFRFGLSDSNDLGLSEGTPNTTPYKPSPLSFGSPRSSPFRRPSFVTSPPPSSPGPVTRPNIPGSPSSRGTTPTHSPSKLSHFQALERESGDVFTNGSNGLRPSPGPRSPQLSPTKGANVQDRFSAMGRPKTPERSPKSNDLLSKIPPAQLREMREAFQVLDRDNDGQVNREDVADALNNLGEDSSSLATGAYFPPNGPRSINLPTYLNQIATYLAPLSSPQELLNAFAAFDEDDSGQIDLAELRDALLHTSPEGDERPLTESEINEVIQGFTSRRAFGPKGKSPSLSGSRSRAEVFRYEEFVGSLTGGAGDPKADKSKSKES
ncbi:hypothetical protein MGYG_05984 [Nannizzia gypsea CBS 118893]|uniref:EF-hand domain-containing protein n=1 Tax=Arthroderma gypseum (strain ATCC MYA-4604 / CBS 118893) TaxID=535722 RepID=E4V049_ARTGP|nr:hypothetical protein MGYG_05984 [Nannizzia gypsea CBS 118893]EFR02986.1 hypothetical protein MGYG_05984 [Nannizzia gypsea CBS 118893]